MKGLPWWSSWLRLCAPRAGGLGLIPGQGTRSHMQKLRVCMLQLQIPCVATKTRYRQKKETYLIKCTLHSPTWLKPFFGKFSETHSLSPRDSLPFSPRVPPAPWASFYRALSHGIITGCLLSSPPWVVHMLTQEQSCIFHLCILVLVRVLRLRWYSVC